MSAIARDTCDPSTLAKSFSILWNTLSEQTYEVPTKTAGPYTHQCVLAHFLILFPTFSIFPSSPAGLLSQVKFKILREDREENR
jgi:hypothetical protein